MVNATCAMCGGVFAAATASKRYCSDRCKWRGRPRIPCEVCGGPSGWSRSSGRQNPICHPCRRRRPGYVARQRKAKGSHVVETHTCGDCERVWQRPPTKGQRPKRCPDCRADDRQWIPAATRRAVYERDGWSCQICHEDVDQHLIGTESEWRPSIDHVVPRSRGGSDEPDNLRLAHLWCNAVLNDGRAYTDDDFRPVAV